MRGGREAQEGGDTCIIMVDFRCCTTETNTTLESNFPQIKFFKKREREKKDYQKPGIFSIV